MAEGGSLRRRGLILALSRGADQAIMLLSPLLLVRILDVTAFGQYREFMLYAVLLKAFISLNAGRNLLYFVPLRPERERQYVTQTVLLAAALGSAGCLLILASGDLIRAATSLDFVLPLVLYLFFLLNSDYFQFYWLAKKRSDVVLFYSTGQLILRLSVVVAVAWYSGDALAIAHALVWFEAARLLAVLIYSAHKGLLSGGWEWTTCKQQLAYFLPLGGSSILGMASENLGRLFVSAQAGVVALSLYTVGTYAMPLRNVIRSSVGDVIFPNMVASSRAPDPQERLHLWQQSTLFLCLLLFPAATAMVVHAELIVVTLFTEQYVAAAPIFCIYALVLVRECFDLMLPVRSAGKTNYCIYVALGGLLLNAALLFPFYHWFGLVGPALAYLLTRAAMAVPLLLAIRRLYGVSLARLLPWDGVVRIALGCAVTAPLLTVVGRWADGHSALTAAAGGVLFGGAYLLFLRLFGSQATDHLVIRLLPRLRRRPV